jgi:diguanylate cyclase (GGDEF)-like protein
MSARRTLLLVDDERMQHRLVGQMLLRFKTPQFDLEVAGTRREGLEKLMRGGYAAALLDYELTDGNGLTLLREARAQGCRTPVIFLTANSGTDLDMAALDAGAADYLEKSTLSPRVLERALRYTLKLADSIEQLRQLATRDQLTGLLNRREFDRILAAELKRGQRFVRPVSLALIDIDHFKRINDTHGHVVGDQVLRHVSDLILRHARSVDFVARYGGEEIAVIMIETHASAACQVVERIARAVADLPLCSAGTTVPVSFSAGIACSAVHGEEPIDLISSADRALYAAKAAGRDRVLIADCGDAALPTHRSLGGLQARGTLRDPDVVTSGNGLYLGMGI